MTNKEATIKNIVETTIAKRGARIVSFTYDSKKRNALIGYKQGAQGFGDRKWGTHISRAIVEYKGKLFLTAKTNNENTEDGHCFKSFALENIENLNCR